VLNDLNLEMVHEYYQYYPAKRMKTDEESEYLRDMETMNQLYKDINNLKLSSKSPDTTLNNVRISNNNFSTIDDDIIPADYSVEIDSSFFELCPEELTAYSVDKEVTRDQINKILIKNAIDSEKHIIKLENNNALVPNEKYIKSI
jgi:hypothetical protein